MNFLKKILSLLDKKDRYVLFGLIIFSILISVMETLGVSVIMPFIQVATDTTLIEHNKYYNYIYNLLHFKDTNSFVIVFGIALIFFYFFRSIINYLYFYRLAAYAQGQYHIIASKLFQTYLKMPYKDFILNNSSVLSKSIITESQLLTTIIIALLMILSEIFVVILIYTVLVIVNLKITVMLTLFLAINALFMVKVVSPKIKQAGIDRAKYQQRFYEIVNRSFGNYKMIKLHGLEEKIDMEFSQSSISFIKANIKNQSLSNFPRLFLEAIAFSLIISIVIYLVSANNGSPTKAMLALISMFVLALYRLMPSVNRIMTAYNQIQFNYKALDIIYDNMQYKSEDLGNRKISFNSAVNLQNISFQYHQNDLVLQDINLTIFKNEKIAIVGESGSGKSTLVDVIIGLHTPSTGVITIDDIILEQNNVSSWRDKIGYIPQTPYLFDGTVGENVAFGFEYDKEKVDIALKQANIYEFFEKKQGDQTKVGENGVMLSGGQRQRIAIARALYKDPEVLVLDEATSALDYETETKIMEEIYRISQSKTLIIIAHRLSTIQGCDKVVEMQNGKIVNISVGIRDKK